MVVWAALLRCLNSKENIIMHVCVCVYIPGNEDAHYSTGSATLQTIYSDLST